MKYNENAFNKAVQYYTGRLKGKIKEKLVFVIIDLKYKKAFYSLAPLSRAVHNLKGEVHCFVKDGKSEDLEVLKDVWYCYRDYKKKLKTKKVKALKDFIRAVNKKTNKRVFKGIFKKPEIILIAEKNYFSGTLDLEYKHKWFRRYRWKELLGAAKRIWKEGYNLKKEKVGIGFVLIPSEKNMELPLEDYLDSYFLALAMALAAKRFKAKVSLSASTDKFSLLAKSVRTVDLMTTLKGCELDKEVDEDVFKKFKVFSKLLRIDRLKYASAGFGIHAKGYYGKHFFGEEIGYPSLDKKTRWTTPGQMMLKDRYSPQTFFESRDPIMRYAVTETLPIDIFIETCDVNYYRLRKRSEKIRDVFNKCKYIRVVGKQTDGYKTDFRVDLISQEGKRREFTAQDSDVRSVIDRGYYKKTGIKTGMYANFPSGEAFVTPESVFGVMVGDVVINIDRSYVIPDKMPLIVEFNEKGYKVVKAPIKILRVMRKERKEARQKIRDYEKNKSLPRDVIKIYKKNFKSVGEFAVNTNPKAKLCNYLIVNEKIARMIHVALGSGFEPDKKTNYHWDIVVNSHKQKLDVYGVDEKNKVHWVIKKGEFVV